MAYKQNYYRIGNKPFSETLFRLYNDKYRCKLEDDINIISEHSFPLLLFCNQWKYNCAIWCFSREGFLFRIKSKSGCGGWCEKYLMLLEKKVLPFISNFLSCTANHFSCLAAALSNVINCSLTSREKMEQFLSDFCHFSLA